MVLSHRGSTRMEQRWAKRFTLATGGQTFVSRRTTEPKSNTTEYLLKKENIGICCIQETNLQQKKI